MIGLHARDHSTRIYAAQLHFAGLPVAETLARPLAGTQPRQCEKPFFAADNQLIVDPQKVVGLM